MGAGELPPGSAGLHLAGSLPLLRPAEQAFEAMLDGWRNQQLARRLAFSTVEGRERAVRAFAAHADAFPWEWSPSLVDEWMTDLRAVRRLRRSTLRGYQIAVRLFCGYVTDPAYGWPAECETRFGTHPVQVVHEWNAAVHVQEAEADPSKRAFTRDELQAFFDYADDQVGAVRAAGRKGWLAAFRDAVLFKVAYGYGLRRNEVRMLDVADFGRNPHAPEFGDLGVCYVRYGKAMKGSPPKRRSVLTVWSWVAEVPGRGVHRRDPAADRPRRREPGAVADRAGRPDQPGLDRPPVRRPPGARSACRPGWTSTRCAAPTSPTSSRTAGTRSSSSNRSATSTRRRPRSTPACRRTSASRRSAAPWTRPSRPRWASARHPGRPDRAGRIPAAAGPPAAGLGRHRDQAKRQLPVAAARGHGRARDVRHDRPRAAAQRTGHRRCRPPRSTGWSPGSRNGCPCRCSRRCATSSRSPPPT